MSDVHEAEVRELAEDIRDMATRVVADEGRLGYASEKLGRGLRYCVRALVRCGWSLAELQRTVRDAFEFERRAMD